MSRYKLGNARLLHSLPERYRSIRIVAALSHHHWGELALEHLRKELLELTETEEVCLPLLWTRSYFSYYDTTNGLLDN